MRLQIILLISSFKIIFILMVKGFDFSQKRCIKNDVYIFILYRQVSAIQNLNNYGKLIQL